MWNLPETCFRALVVALSVVLSASVFAHAPGSSSSVREVPPAGAPSQAPGNQAAQAPGLTQPDVQGPPAVQGGEATALPRDLSPWGMFLAADIVVKAVMIGLVIASLLTWTVWLAKSFELMTARVRARRGHDALTKARSLSQAAAQLGARRGSVVALAQAAHAEINASGGLPADGIKERIGQALERIEARAGRRINRGTGVLATIGATAPFVGLFGTVWGIMNSFIGISKAHTTNLAVVAPGIAEALLATAMGLVAAIPAVVIYNMFARQMAGYRAMLADSSAEILRLVSRDLDRQSMAGRRQMHGDELQTAAE
jgi:biopolymer transport protein ExbB